MAPAHDAYAASTLKAVTFRLASVPPRQLPGLIPLVTATLPVCKPVLAAPQNASGKDASEAAVLVHKLRTQISTLLQDRSPEGRWSAVVLCKTAIELGGWEMLQKCGPWVRGLLGILTKPDPATTKVLAIVALTRIFMLTRDYQTLVREITTPSLTPFITSCVNILSRPKSADPATQQLVETILESFRRLLPRHPTTFRPHLSKINQFLACVVAPASPDQQNLLSTDGLAAARSLYAQLPACAAKGGSKDEWEKTLQNVIIAAHHTADKVFRAVIEDWDSVTGVQPANTTNRTLEQVVQQVEPDLCGFPGWSGIYAGSQRLIGLLELLAELTASPTGPTAAVNFRIAHLMDLSTRVLSLTAPAAQGKRNQDIGITFNDQIGKEERNDLFTVLPHIHVAAFGLFEVLADRFGQMLSPVADFFLERLTFLFQEESSLAIVRTASYSVLAKVLPFVGSTLAALQIKSLNPIMRACCDDLLPRETNSAQKNPPAAHAKGGKNQAQGSMNADSFLGNGKPSSTQQTAPAGLYEYAYELLPLFLAHLPVLDNSLRSRIEGTAVLIQHEKALLASVLSLDSKGSTSILPILARQYSDSPDVEALIRPRVPAIRGQNSGSLDADVEEGEEDDEEDEEEQDTAEQSRQKPDQEDEMQIDETTTTEKDEPAIIAASQTKEESPAIGTAVEPLVAEHAEPSPPLSARDGPEKRPSTETAAEAPSPKRSRVSSPPRDLPRQGQQEPSASALPAAVPAQTNYAGADDADDDDEDVEIPTLVMGDDEDDSDEED